MTDHLEITQVKCVINVITCQKEVITCFYKVIHYMLNDYHDLWSGQLHINFIFGSF